MKVLHINVSLADGGAAKIALDIHEQLLANGHESCFAYGWGKKAGRSDKEDEITGAIRIGRRVQVITNYLSSRVFGIDVVRPTRTARSTLTSLLTWADIIHLHVVHSYFIPFTFLIDSVISSRRPVVWTLHDYWGITGRCASLEGCDRWTNGCGECPAKNNYPPAMLDFTRSSFKAKRRMIARLGADTVLVAPSRTVANAFQLAFPERQSVVIGNWIDRELERALVNLDLGSLELKSLPQKLKVLVVANNLADGSKVDSELINELISEENVELHTIGRNSPFLGANVVNHGRVADRKKYAGICSNCDLSIFTSKKDSFGLVMIESVACGVPVLAIESPASNEIMATLNLECLVNRDEVKRAIVGRTLPASYHKYSGRSLSKEVIKRFSANTNINQYIKIYESLLTDDVC